MRVAVIGAGWAGMAAAVALTQGGCRVTVIEAARTLGGRARSLTAQGADAAPLVLDNGQHILIGAYRQTLNLMRAVGVDVQSALLRTPLTLTYSDQTGLQMPDLPPPWDALVGVLRARGWSWSDKLGLLRACAGWQIRGFRCDERLSVAQLCRGLPQRLLQEFIEPLCVSALNTPAGDASAQVFLRVLRDSLFSGRGGSHLLLPRTDLGALFPDAASQWLHTRGAVVQPGVRTLAGGRDPLRSRRLGHTQQRSSPLGALRSRQPVNCRTGPGERMG
jgi:predicted NAD/FAD-binding protein